MKRIRIGKDILITWSILTNGVPQPLKNRDLKLILITPLRNTVTVEYTISDNIISCTYPGNMHKCLGKYSLTLWENYGKEGQTAVDACNAFQLVPTTCEEGGDDEGLETETVELSGFMDANAGMIPIPDAPSDGETYGRNNGEWVPVKGSTSAQFDGNILLFNSGPTFNDNVLVI